MDASLQAVILKTKADTPRRAHAVRGYLHALDLKQQEQLQIDRLAATKDASQGLYGGSGAYSDQDLALFSTGWSEHRYSFDPGGNLKVERREK
jgi:endoglucanase